LGKIQRIRLDRDREASRDLNRLLDEPDPAAWAATQKTAFLEYPWGIELASEGMRAGLK
jgi:hypothetical protein